MNYQISINTDNAAFEDDPTVEVVRILYQLMHDIETRGLSDYNLRDINGNKVGKAGEV
jgi:hypothetical protein